MTIVSRDILAEFFKVFLITLTALTVLVMLFGVVNEAIKQGLGLGPIVRLMPYVLPHALHLTIPGTTLFAVCSVYGKLAAQNELVALKSAGISPLVVLRPMFVVVCLISLLAVGLNDVAASWGRRGMQRVVIESVEEIAYGMLKTQRSYSTGRFSISVKRVDGHVLILPVVKFQATADKPSITIMAKEARLHADLEANVLKLAFRDGTIDIDGDVTVRFPGVEEYEVPLAAATRREDRSDHPTGLPQWKIPAARRRQAQKIADMQQQYAAKAAYQMMTGDVESLADQRWQDRLTALEGERGVMNRLNLERYRRWSDGFACLCFAMVGAPLAIRRRNADFLTSFFLCFMPILVVYYPLLMAALTRAKTGEWPGYAIWLGNLLLVGWGLGLMRKVMRY
ncbi:MAG: LptF/LptG family permease [Planctomycetes bacterium]|nr:LptF/LptG family permease [Planctomycetota bacterium]